RRERGQADARRRVPGPHRAHHPVRRGLGHGPDARHTDGDARQEVTGMATEVVRQAGRAPAKVTVPPRSLRGDLRAVKVVWQRELIRFARDRMRIVVALLQPLLFLFVLGTGLSSMVPAGAGGVGLRTFLFPGVLSMGGVFTPLVSA